MLRRKKILIGVLFVLLVAIFKMPVLNLPAVGDETAYINGALSIYQNKFNPFVEYWSYKPPFLFILAAFAYKLFGFSIVISRMIIVLFSSLAIYFTFLLGTAIYNRIVGIWAALLLFISPLFFTHSGFFFVTFPLQHLLFPHFIFT